MKIAAAAVALLALSSGQALADVITVQTRALGQLGNDPIRDNRPISFAPFDATSGILTEATLRVTASYTPSFFNAMPAPDYAGITGVCVFGPIFPTCIDVPEAGNFAAPFFFTGAPVSIDRTIDVTAAALKADSTFTLSYIFGTTPPNGSAIDSTYYSGSAILTYFDPPLPVPEPNPLGIMVLALLSAGLIRRRC